MILMQGYQRGREIESYQVDNQEHVLLFGLKKLHQFDIGKTNSDELKLKKKWVSLTSLLISQSHWSCKESPNLFICAFLTV